MREETAVEIAPAENGNVSSVRSLIPPKAAYVLGVPIWGLTLDEFVDLASNVVKQGKKTLFSTANANSLVLFQNTPLSENIF